MYEPPLHRQEDLAAQHELIRAHPLGLADQPRPERAARQRDPVPDLSPAPRSSARCRPMSRAPTRNGGICRSRDEALVVFQGVEHYITPSWYETKRETGKVVPTWNYVIVQARGRPRVIEDAGWLRAQIEALTRKKESERADALGGRRRAGGFHRRADPPDRRRRDRDRRHQGQVEGEPEPQGGRPRRRDRGARGGGRRGGGRDGADRGGGEPERLRTRGFASARRLDLGGGQRANRREARLVELARRSLVNNSGRVKALDRPMDRSHHTRQFSGAA